MYPFPWYLPKKKKKKITKIVRAFCCGALAQKYIFKWLDRVGVKSTNHINLTESDTSDPGAGMMCFFYILALFSCLYCAHIKAMCFFFNAHRQKHVQSFTGFMAWWSHIQLSNYWNVRPSAPNVKLTNERVLKIRVLIGFKCKMEYIQSHKVSEGL